MLEIIQQRRSIRAYQDTKIKDKDMETIKEAIRLSPTWKNKQCFEVIVITDRKIQLEIGRLVNFNPCESAYTKAPCLFVFVADPSKSGNRDEKPYYMSDTAIAVEHAVLSATALSLATCWVGVFPEEKLKSLLNVPEHLKVVALTPLGYADEEVAPRPRRNSEEVFHYNKY